MFETKSDGMFRPAIQKTRTLVLMAVICLISYSVAVLSKVVIISDTYEIKLNAARQMQAAMDYLKTIRMEESVIMDPENDPNETGIVGSQFSLITTDEGDLDAKLTTLDPNFAAAMIELLHQAQVSQGDTVAVLLTGSMPGANIACLVACDVLGIEPVVITSVGASQWGANLIDFTWLDMEQLLFDSGYISAKSLAASIGGRNDMGRLLSPRGRQIIIENIDIHGLEFIREKSLAASVERRMQIFGAVSDLNKYAVFINVGGGVASLGTSFNHKLLQPGLVYRRDVESISRTGGIEGALTYFAKSNVPIIHILNIQSLTKKLGMPYAPIPLPGIGSGKLYSEARYNLFVTAICLIIVIGTVVFIGYRSHQQIKARMEQHEPDSVL
ncbi:MAG: poly-gamma-glutamate system protein [Candidatus Marinimicrobia bacterium]|nr:poly-gamma-glutamate system protein [Candidatus Neomarinimicrobiota bacterium]